MEAIQISPLWLGIIGIQATVIILLANKLLGPGSKNAKDEIEFAKGISKEHVGTEYINYILPGTDSHELEMNIDNAKFTSTYKSVLAIGLLVFIFTLCIAAFLNTTLSGTKKIFIEDSSFHQQQKVLLIKISEWKEDLTNLAKTHKLEKTSFPSRLGLRQEDLDSYERLIFGEDSPQFYELILMIICLVLTALPILWSFWIKRRIFRNSSYIASSYAFAATKILFPNPSDAISVVKCLEKHRDNCAGYKSH